MKNQKNSQHPLNIHSVSKEGSNCPLIPMLIEICQIAKEELNCPDSLFLPSAVFGKRVAIASSFTKVEKLHRDDVVELIDYNPVSNTLLYLGPNIPSNDVAVHWIVHHAKKEIQVMIQIKNISYKNEMKQRVPQVTTDEKEDALEKAKKWLKTLQKTDVFLCNDHLIITATSIKAIKQTINKMGKELQKT
ncbi:MAG: hypothetical protein R6U21_05225 [Thermoplasmatota archaeon]